METSSEEFKEYLKSFDESEWEYRKALQEYKLARHSGKGIDEAFSRYKEEAVKIDKW